MNGSKVSENAAIDLYFQWNYKKVAVVPVHKQPILGVWKNLSKVC